MQDERQKEKARCGVTDHSQIHVDLALHSVPNTNRRGANTSHIELRVVATCVSHSFVVHLRIHSHHIEEAPGPGMRVAHQTNPIRSPFWKEHGDDEAEPSQDAETQDGEARLSMLWSSFCLPNSVSVLLHLLDLSLLHLALHFGRVRDVVI